MTGLAARFFGTAIIYAVLGMALGNYMGKSHDHSQMPTHAHMLLIGWVSFAIYGFFYHLFPSIAARGLAKVHFWLSEASLLFQIGGLFLLLSGTGGAEPVVGIASIGLLLSAVVFGVVALPLLRSRA